MMLDNSSIRDQYLAHLKVKPVVFLVGIHWVSFQMPLPQTPNHQRA